MIHDPINLYTTDGSQMQTSLNGFFFKCGIDSNDKMVYIEMVLYYEKKSENIFTKFIAFEKYLESW